MDRNQLKDRLIDIGLHHHHEHLGGCVKSHLLWEIAKQRGINPLGVNSYELFDSRFVVDHMDHDAYVDNKFALTHIIQSSPDAVKMSVFYAASEAYRTSKIKSLEIRFNPMFRNQEKFYDLDVIIMNAVAGAKLASQAYPIKVGIIIEADRRFNQEQMQILAEKAVQYTDIGVCGFDISGGSDEPIRDFRNSFMGDIYEYLTDNHVYTTIHLSETGDKNEVDGAILDGKENVLHRIGHGIHIYNDERIMDKVINNDICLEICPTSNVKLGVVNGWHHMGHILRKLYDYGVEFSINTDATEFMGITLLDEYLNLFDRSIFSYHELIEIARTSGKYSFV